MKHEIKERVEAALTAYRDEIIKAIGDNPTESYESLSRRYCVSSGYVYRLARANGLRRRADKREVSNG